MKNQSDHKQQHMDKNLETQKTAIDPKYGDQPWQSPTYSDKDKSQGQLASMKDSKDKSRGYEPKQGESKAGESKAGESKPVESKEESSWGSKDNKAAATPQKQHSEIGNKTHGNQNNMNVPPMKSSLKKEDSENKKKGVTVDG